MKYKRFLEVLTNGGLAPVSWAAPVYMAGAVSGFKFQGLRPFLGFPPPEPVEGWFLFLRRFYGLTPVSMAGAVSRFQVSMFNV